PAKKISQLVTKKQAERRTAPAPGKAASATSKSAARVTNVPAATLDRFGQAMTVARLAAEKELFALSLRAVREALKGGPPIGNGQGEPAFGSMYGSAGMARARVLTTRGMMMGGETDPSSQQVEAQLAVIERTWSVKRVPAGDAYEALRDVVMPPGRPTE